MYLIKICLETRTRRLKGIVNGNKKDRDVFNILTEYKKK